MSAAQSTEVLDDLDRERPSQPFVVEIDGQLVRFGAATDATWQELLAALRYWPVFVRLFGPRKRRRRALVEGLPVWKMQALVRAWRVHHGLCASDTDHARLLGQLRKAEYRAAIECDLREAYGLDLTTEFQARRWRSLLNMVDGLRRTSHLQEVMAQDDDLADRILEQEDRDGEPATPRRRMLEFSTEVEMLSVIADRVGELTSVMGATKGARRRTVKPMPRPETALKRARNRRAARKHRYTTARVFGYIDAQGNPTGKQPEGGAPLTF